MSSASAFPMEGLGSLFHCSAQSSMALVRWSMLQRLPRRRRRWVSSAPQAEQIVAAVLDHVVVGPARRGYNRFDPASPGTAGSNRSRHTPMRASRSGSARPDGRWCCSHLNEHLHSTLSKRQQIVEAAGIEPASTDATGRASPSSACVQCLAALHHAGRCSAGQPVVGVPCGRHGPPGHQASLLLKDTLRGGPEGPPVT